MANISFPSSNRFLFILFILSLPVFMFARWDSSAWLSNQIQSQAKTAGINVHYDSTAISGLGVSFENLSVKSGNIPGAHFPELYFDMLSASISLTQLMTGNTGAAIDASWENNPVSLTIAQTSEQLVFSDIDAVIDLSRLSIITQKLPVQIAGVATIRGDASIDQQKQLPQTVQLSITLQGAKAGLASPEFALGDFNIEIKSNEDPAHGLIWGISGSDSLGLDGQGSLVIRNPDPQYWLINGMVDIDASKADPSLAMMLKAVAGNAHAKVRLSGSLGKPRTDFIR